MEQEHNKTEKKELTFEEKLEIYEEKLQTIGEEPYLKMHDVPILTREEEALMNIKVQEGDERFKDYFIIANIRLVIKTASRIDYYTSNFHNFEKEDLIQEGIDGLIRAVEKFDHTKGYKFSTYATFWIEQKITRAIETKAKNMKYPAHFASHFNNFIKTSEILSQELNREPTIDEIATEMGITTEAAKIFQTERTRRFVSLDDPISKDNEDGFRLDRIEDVSAKNPEEEAIKKVSEQEIEALLKFLRPKEQEVLKLRYGFNDEEPKTLAEVGEKYGITRERVRQIEFKALRKLKRELYRQDLKNYQGSKIYASI